MRRLTRLGCVLFVVVGSEARAQSSDKDFAAWSGIMFSPVGAFAPIEASASGSTAGAKQLAIRVSSWKFPGSNVRENSLGASYMVLATSRARYSVTLGWTEPSEGSGAFLVGGDVSGALWQSSGSSGGGSAFSVDLKGSLGMGHTSGTVGGTVWSAVAQLPFKWRYQMANKSDLSAYVTPGFGLAGTTDVGSQEAATGTRPMISLGGAWTSVGGIGIHLGTQRVPLDLGPVGGNSSWVVGGAVSFPIGG